MVKTESTMAELGSSAPEFALPNIDGNIISKSDFQGKPLLVMFICNHCPFVKHLRDKLAEIGNTYTSKGVGVVAISSNDVENYPDDSPEKMKEEAENIGYRFPYLYDETQEVAQAYTAACTPDFFLYDADHALYYRGQFDSTRPGDTAPVTGEDLIAALEAVLSGLDKPEKQIPSLGCNIKWKPGQNPPYFNS